MSKKVYKLISLLFIITLGLFLAGSAVKSDSGSDAIAIRVVPNTEHYSIERWYQEQGFSGSPQALTVDGYQAVRDGRTVYVNAANIDISGNLLYTNIYLISYNQESEQSTVDILGQIVSHWRFNHNLTGSGKCALSSVTCSVDEDCSGGYVCGNDQHEFQDNKCVMPDDSQDLLDTRSCLNDDDCPSNLFCTSLKSGIVRDIRRLGQITELKVLLADYLDNNGTYPKLSAGTYLPQVSVSTWPSWQGVLGQNLRFNSGLVDPINTLGSCPGNFNIDTCWNEDLQKFYDPFPSNGLDLPDNSFVYVYTTDINGVNYDVCANMESNYDTADAAVSNFDCASTIGYAGQFDNSAPVLEEYMLAGSSQETFNGFIKVMDPDGDPLTWQLNIFNPSWSGWSAPPVLQNTENPNQKKIFAQLAGNNGIYPITLMVSDNEGNVLVEVLDIEISNLGPQIQAEDVNYIMSLQNPLDYSLFIYDNNLPESVSSLVANLTVAYPSDFPSPLGGVFSSAQSNIGHGITKNFYRISNDTYKMTLTGLPGDLDGDGDIDDPELDIMNFTLYVEDTNGVGSVESFSINIVNNPPILNFECGEVVRLNNEYMCQIEVENPTSGTSYSFDGLPQGLSGSAIGLINGTPSLAGIYNVEVTVSNEYGGEDVETFSLVVNSYCGDGSIQLPNMELAGGPYNDGYEDCDINAGIAIGPNAAANSGPNKTYECTTSEDTSYPVPQGSCTFIGGYCGDGQLQPSNEECDFGPGSTCCSAICAWNADYNEEQLFFQGNETETTLTSDQSDNIIFPDVRGFDNNSGVVDAEMIGTSESTAVVYITDQSGSMPSGVPGVRMALIGTTDVNASAAEPGSAIFELREAALNDDADISVGLVEFGTNFTSLAIDIIADDSHYAQVVNRIAHYDDNMSGTTMPPAITEAHDLLNNVSTMHKYMVLLGDGASSGDPSVPADAAKAAGIEIYTIAYNNSSISYNMCKWSSDDTVIVCPDTSSEPHLYSYLATNASVVYEQITEAILNVPSGVINVIINGQNVNFNATTTIVEDIWMNFSSIQCIQETGVCSPDLVSFEPSFGGGGAIRFYNLRLGTLDPCN